MASPRRWLSSQRGVWRSKAGELADQGSEDQSKYWRASNRPWGEPDLGTGGVSGCTTRGFSSTWRWITAGWRCRNTQPIRAAAALLLVVQRSWRARPGLGLPHTNWQAPGCLGGAEQMSAETTSARKNCREISATTAGQPEPDRPAGRRCAGLRTQRERAFALAGRRRTVIGSAAQDLAACGGRLQPWGRLDCIETELELRLLRRQFLKRLAVTAWRHGVVGKCRDIGCQGQGQARPSRPFSSLRLGARVPGRHIQIQTLESRRTGTANQPANQPSAEGSFLDLLAGLAQTPPPLPQPQRWGR